MKVYYKLICITIISIFCLRATILNLKPELFIGGDIGVRTAFPMQTLKDAVHMWNSDEGPGRDNTYSTTYIILSLFLLLLKIVGFSQVVFTKIFYFLLLFIAGISSYFLVLYILAEKDSEGFKTHFCAMSGALIYTFNYFSRTLFNNPSGHQPMVYSFFPLALLLFIKGLEKEDKKIYYAILFGIVSIFIFSCNLAHVGAGIIILALYFVYYISRQKRFRQPLRFVLLASLISLLLSAFIIFPMASSLGMKENLEKNIGLGWFSMGSWLYISSYFIRLFRIDGSASYPPNFPIYKPAFIVFGYLMPIMAFSSLFWLKRNRYILFFTILSLIGLFLAKGCQQPFGQIFFYIGKFFPPFTIFKYSYDKFSMLITISYAVMIGFSLQQYFNYWFRWLVLAIIPVFICISWPFIMGRLDTGCFFPKIPKSYFETVDWMNHVRSIGRVRPTSNGVSDKSSDFKILSLPPSDGNYTYYNWGYFGQDLFLTLLGKPIMESARVLNDVIRRLIKDRSYYPFCRILRLLNVEYILLHNDAHNPDILPNFIKDLIWNKNGLRYYRSFGELDLFKVNPIFYRPHIYASRTPVLVVSNNIDTIYPIIYSRYLRCNPVLFFSRSIRKLKHVMKESPMLSTIVYDNRDIDNENMDEWMGQIQMIKNNKPDLLEDSNSAYIYKGDSEFTIEKDDLYRVKAIVLAKPYLIRRRRFSNVNFKDRNSFIINTCNVSYETSINDIGIVSAQTYFDGDSKEDEFIQIQLKDFKTDLKQYPYFYLTYRVEDTKIQTIEIVISIDLNGDGIPDDILKNLYPQPASQDMARYIINIYDLIKEKYPDKEYYNVVNLELYPHKIWWTDCSKQETKGLYRFWIKEAGFYGYLPDKGHYVTNRAIDLVDGLVCNYNPSEYILREAGGSLVVSREKSYVEISRWLKDIGVYKYPWLELIYEIVEPNKVESISLILALDNGNSIILDNLPMYNGFNRYSVDIKEVVEDRFSMIDKFCLDSLILRLGLSDEVDDIGDIFILKGARLSNKIFEPADGYICKKSIFRLDKDTYLFANKFGNIEDARKVVFTKSIFLQKGRHYIKNLVGGNLDFFIIEPENNKIPNPPSVSFNRVNSTRYEVKLTTDKSCWLVFSESFNPKWKAYVYRNQKPVTRNQKPAWSALWQMWKDRCKRVEIKEHYMVNGYANAWYIPEGRSQKSEVRNIIIEYIPQRFFKLGCIISGLSLVGVCIGPLLIKKNRL